MAKLVRNFGQSPDYWLDTCTLRDWTDIWSRELLETPPADDMVAAYLGYKPPAGSASADDDNGEPEIWECELPDVTE